MGFHLSSRQDSVNGIFHSAHKMTILEFTQTTAAILAVSLTAGCVGKSPQDPYLRTWGSPDASLHERVEAVRHLVPTGTRIVDAEKILGEPKRRERWHGPAAKTGTTGLASRAPERDEYVLIYESSGGGAVYLHFDITASRSAWQEWPLVDVWGESTNAVRVRPRE